jgi:hypothetical protein
MPYVVGIVLSLTVALFARRVGFDRDRAFYPTVLIVIASYYVVRRSVAPPPSPVRSRRDRAHTRAGIPSRARLQQ